MAGYLERLVARATVGAPSREARIVPRAAGDAGAVDDPFAEAALPAPVTPRAPADELQSAPRRAQESTAPPRDRAGREPERPLGAPAITHALDRASAPAPAPERISHVVTERVIAQAPAGTPVERAPLAPTPPPTLPSSTQVPAPARPIHVTSPSPPPARLAPRPPPPAEPPPRATATPSERLSVVAAEPLGPPRPLAAAEPPPPPEPPRLVIGRLLVEVVPPPAAPAPAARPRAVAPARPFRAGSPGGSRRPFGLGQS